MLKELEFDDTIAAVYESSARENMIQNLRLHFPVTVLFLLLTPLLSSSGLAAQTKKKQAVIDPATLLTQKTTRHEVQRFGYGGTVTIVGAPQGSITVEGWPRNEVAVVAEIELKAENETDLKLLSTVNSFVFDQDLNHVRLMTTGTHDKEFLKRVAKNFPKRLLGLPWSITYRVRVPVATDVEIDAGRGPVRIAGVEGAIRLSAAESDASLELTGGTVNVTIGHGTLHLRIPVRSWRGAGADVRVAAGKMMVELAPGFSGDIDAEILRSGAIENSFEPLESRERPGITSSMIKARAGAGGAFFRFTMGDGTIVLKKTENLQN